MEGTRTPEYEAALKVFNDWRVPGIPGQRCPTKAEQAVIFAEESFAWRHAYELLSELGVTAWSTFETERARSLNNYVQMFRNMESPEWTRPAASAG